MSNTEMPTNQDSIFYVGEVTMEANGDIVLTYHRTTDGLFAESQERFRPGTKDYEEVIKHVGGLKPGESKLVPAWQD